MNGRKYQVLKSKVRKYQALKTKVRKIHSTKKVKKMTTTENQKDVFSIYTKNFDKVKSAFERSYSQYAQSTANLNQEIIATWTNFVHTSTALQQSIANKMGVNTTLPEQTINFAQESVDAFLKAVETNSKVAQTILDATVQNIKTVNQNSSSFAELNQNVINSWISIWKPRN
jgi:vacuolar-type H+-ATPase subunit D/Vma8